MQRVTVEGGGGVSDHKLEIHIVPLPSFSCLYICYGSISDRKLGLHRTGYLNVLITWWILCRSSISKQSSEQFDLNRACDIFRIGIDDDHFEFFKVA